MEWNEAGLEDYEIQRERESMSEDLKIVGTLWQHERNMQFSDFLNRTQKWLILFATR